MKFDRIQIRDFKVIARADVELSNRGLVLVQGRNQDTDAADSNGSGKTTMFEALSWCLFGEIVGQGGRLAEEVIRVGAEKTSVAVTFSDDEHTYTVTRKRTPKTGTLELTTDGAATNGRTQAETEARIRGVLGLDWSSFRNTILHGQGDHARFADRGVTDADRKAILKRILRLERFDVALEAVRLARKAVASELNGLKAEALQLEGEVGQAARSLRRLEDLSAAWVVDHERKIAVAEATSFPDLSAEERKLMDQLPRMLELEKGLQRQVTQANEAQIALRKAQNEEERARAKLDRIRGERAGFERELGRVQGDHDKAAAAADSNRCPTCGQNVEDDNRHLARHLETLQARISGLKSEIATVDERIANGEDVVRGLSANVVMVSDTADSLGDPDHWTRELERIRKLIGAARVAEQRAEGLADSRRNHEGRLALLRAESDPNVEPLAAARQTLRELEEQQHENEEAQAEVEGRDAPLKFWETAFSNRGLPSLALDTVVPMISTAANRYLQVLADGDLSVDVSTTTETKGGAVKDSIEFRFLVEGTENVTPSGGQWRKFGLAIDLALMDLVAAREGARIDLLLLDEVLDGLDAEGRSRVVALLRVLRETRSSVFVVSHDPEIAENFENIIMITKKDGAAIVEDGQ